MSVLVKEDYANPEIPLWASKGSGAGGGVNSVSAGYGISITGTTANPIVNNTGVIRTVSASNSQVAGIKMSVSLASILGGMVVPLPLNQKTLVSISYSIRLQNTTGTADDYYIDPVLGGVSIRTGNASAFDYTTTGNQHWATVSGVVSSIFPAGTLGATTFDIYMKANSGAGQMYVYSTNAVVTVSYAP